MTKVLCEPCRQQWADRDEATPDWRIDWQDGGSGKNAHKQAFSCDVHLAQELRRLIPAYTTASIRAAVIPSEGPLIDT